MTGDHLPVERWAASSGALPILAHKIGAQGCLAAPLSSPTHGYATELLPHGGLDHGIWMDEIWACGSMFRLDQHPPATCLPFHDALYLADRTPILPRRAYLPRTVLLPPRLFCRSLLTYVLPTGGGRAGAAAHSFLPTTHLHSHLPATHPTQPTACAAHLMTTTVAVRSVDRLT